MQAPVLPPHRRVPAPWIVPSTPPLHPNPRAPTSQESATIAISCSSWATTRHSASTRRTCTTTSSTTWHGTSTGCTRPTTLVRRPQTPRRPLPLAPCTGKGTPGGAPVRREVATETSLRRYASHRLEARPGSSTIPDPTHPNPLLPHADSNGQHARVSRWQGFQYLLLRHNIVVAVGIFCFVRLLHPRRPGRREHCEPAPPCAVAQPMAKPPVPNPSLRPRASAAAPTPDPFAR